MDNRKKNIIYSIILIAAILIVARYRRSGVAEPVTFDGRTMGTTYHVTYFDEAGRNFKSSIDSLLILVNKSINTYDSTSEVSRFNTSDKGIAFELPFLGPPLLKGKAVYAASNGAFDVTVMPLVNAWGFGPKKKIQADSATIDTIRDYVGFDKIRLTDDSILKTDPRVQLDFGGIGQGYGADVIAEFLKSKGIRHMLVELGGEGVAAGKNLKTDKAWEIGILDPNSTRENQFFKAYISLSDRAFTTSGNYFNYHIIDGIKYSHTIDPSTGYPAKRAILSASVFASNCTIADAWGTAFMVMGHEKAIEFLEMQNDLDALLMYSDEKGNVATYATKGIRSVIRVETKQL